MVGTPALLAGLSDADRRRVIAACERNAFAPGDFVFHQDADADALHLVAAGHFAVRAAAPDGTSAMVAVVGPGESFGEVGLLSRGQRRTAAVSALTEAETLALDRRRFEVLCRARPRVREIVDHALAAHVARLTVLLAEALHLEADARILRRLASLALIYGEGDRATVPLRQDDLAQLAGTSRATVNRVLGAQERAGTLRVGRGRVEVLDVAALQRSGRA